ncbi:Transcriptional regulator, contains XRE-family HTH domain [Lachnospiraceae bacterium G11]|nr:Transcriptional regulator, contains XRE-family HTH domain [Lachnospiraceae bacterium G11]
MDAERTGIIIRESRTKKEMTQQALADAINVSATAVSKWENGHSLPDITMLEPLSIALDISISELVLGERSEEKMGNDVETPKDGKQDEAIKSIIGESIRQRRRVVLRWVLVTLSAAAIMVAAILFLFMIGFPAKQDNIRVKTEIQNNNGSPEWVIHFETVDGQPLYEYSEETYVSTDEGGHVFNGQILHLRVAPLGNLDPGAFTWGYSVENGLMPTDDYDFFVVVDYGDGDVTYSMREEGLFE